MVSCYLVLLLLLTSFPSLSQSLVIHYNYKNNTKLLSRYSTLGKPPTQSIYAPVVFLSKSNFSEDCYFSSSTNISQLNGKIAVLSSMPMWIDCTSESNGVITAIARLYQKVGGIGVITPQSEKVYNYCLYIY